MHFAIDIFDTKPRTVVDRKNKQIDIMTFQLLLWCIEYTVKWTGYFNPNLSFNAVLIII